MNAKPTILVIGSATGLVADETWANFTTNFNVKSYDFPTNAAFHDSLRSGDCKDVDGIVRLGLNLPEGCEKVLIGWTHRGLAHFPPSLKVIVNFGHGYNDEAVDELREKGITFFNTTGGSQSTAAVGIYLIVATFRNLSREMKRGVRVINIARGLCIDEEALCDAIEEGIVGGAGLDVYHDE
ncbi:hypothetical protein NW757_003034 [Fusarium falciforme]|nr:hypothetical protein NW757_003034 [Fusarium falciforme]